MVPLKADTKIPSKVPHLCAPEFKAFTCTLAPWLHCVMTVAVPVEPPELLPIYTPVV